MNSSLVDIEVILLLFRLKAEVISRKKCKDDRNYQLEELNPSLVLMADSCEKHPI